MRYSSRVILSDQLSEAMKPAKRWITIHRDPETSEVDWTGESLKNALAIPASEGAEIIQGGVTLADATGKGSRWSWRLTTTGKKVLGMEKAKKDILHPPRGWW